MVAAVAVASPVDLAVDVVAIVTVCIVVERGCGSTGTTPFEAILQSMQWQAL